MRQFELRSGRLTETQVSTKIEADDAAEVAHLTLGECVLRMRCETGIDDRQDFGTRFEELSKGIAPMLFCRNVEAHVQVRVISHKRAHNDIAVSADVLGNAVHNNIRAKSQWCLDVRRRQCVIDYQDRTVAVSDFSDSLDVDDIQFGIGRCFRPAPLRAHVAYAPLYQIVRHSMRLRLLQAGFDECDKVD